MTPIVLVNVGLLNHVGDLGRYRSPFVHPLYRNYSPTDVDLGVRIECRVEVPGDGAINRAETARPNHGAGQVELAKDEATELEASDSEVRTSKCPESRLTRSLFRW